MMLREPWALVAVLSIGFAVSGAQTAKPVKPTQGPPPDQAVAPDVSSQLPAGQQEQFPEPVVPVAPTPQAAPAPLPEPEPPAQKPVAKPETKLQEKPETTSPEPPVIPAKTPEGRRLQQETATLLELARQLKADLEKAGANTLSVDAVRKADEIQKMTKSLKEEMSKQGQVAQAK